MRLHLHFQVPDKVINSDFKIRVITNGHLLICDWCFRILKGSKMQSLDSDKRCC